MKPASALFPFPVPGSRLVVFLLFLSTPAHAQDPLSRAFDLERRGSFAQAAEIYRGVLQKEPGEVTALLGLERSLTPINRLPELLPAVRAAIIANPTGAPIYSIGLRAYSAANMLDSLPHLVELWARAAPGDESPYREWAASALQRRDRPMARRAYQLGRERLGKPEALAAELAQLASAEEDWPTAAREWVGAVRQLQGYRSSATTALANAPAAARPVILSALAKEAGPEAARISVELRARWGDPVGALETLLGVLPKPLPQQLDVLQGFLELTRLQSSPTYQQAQARTLEALADRWANPPQRARFRLDAARAYAAAGQPEPARRVLGQIASDPASGPVVAAGATTTLIELLVRDGKADEAAGQLEKYRSTVAVDDYLRLRRAVALRWAESGALERAEQMLETDSTIEALAVRGRIRLYAGDLKGASDYWREAGPFAGTREEATDRSIWLALLQPIKPDTLVPFGLALQLLDRGDTLKAAQSFERIAAGLPPNGGGADLHLLAGRLQAAAGQVAEAERLFRTAVVKEMPGTAAAALLELGRLQLATERRAEATQTLEEMILDYPTSALVPQARRLLDQSRNAVPRT